jgi:pyridoxamine--pyruvate transaminase
MDIHPDACAADIFVTAPQKCLGCPPGLTIMGISKRAWEKMKNNPAAPRASMLSILDWEPPPQRQKSFPFTPSVAELNGLDAALNLYLEEGPERVWERHALTSAACRAGVQAMGLKLWAAQERFASPTATAIRVPPGIDETAVRDTARANYGVLFSAGRGETLGKLIRIGHMGPTAQPIYATVAVTALGGTLRTLGHPVDVGAGVDAALATIDAAQSK